MAGIENSLNKVGFIGAGKMAQALASGMIKSGMLQYHEIWASAPSMTNLTKFKEMKCNVTHNNADVLLHCNIIFLCVKPHLISNLLRELNTLWKQHHLIVSVISGITLNFLELQVPLGIRIIRSMPNTPSVIQAGACAIAKGSYATANDVEIVTKLLRSVGICDEIPESQMNAIGGLSGSGPAYIYTVIQAMADGAVKMGISKPFALKYAAQTVMGAAKMVLETSEHPEVLRDNVCSPGGTTITAIHILEKSGIRAAMMSAVEAATLKAEELGNM